MHLGSDNCVTLLQVMQAAWSLQPTHTKQILHAAWVFILLLTCLIYNSICNALSLSFEEL